MKPIRLLTAQLTRRDALRTGALLTAASMLGRTGATLAEVTPALEETPSMTAGPFYPRLKPLDPDADLTIVAGTSRRAQGQVIHLAGRVIDVSGRPVDGATIEIWQANAFGRYGHPDERSDAPLDPNFQGYGAQRTDSEGRFRFKTIRPASYPAGGRWFRAPHIHVAVGGTISRKVTQMFFEGEALNAQDPLLRAIRHNREGLVGKVLPPTEDLEPDSLLVAWDVVISHD